jgi:hypothetical protein
MTVYVGRGYAKSLKIRENGLKIEKMVEQDSQKM